jgi:hypothetical protein
MAQEEDLAHKLDGVKYEIDSPDSIQLFESGRIENVCCLPRALVSITHGWLFSSCCLCFTSLSRDIYRL